MWVLAGSMGASTKYKPSNLSKTFTIVAELEAK
jgi:hypothetical protein